MPLTGNALACHRFAGISAALDGILASASTGPLASAPAATLRADSADLDRWAKGATDTVQGSTELFLGGDMTAAALGLAAVTGIGSAEAAEKEVAQVMADCSKISSSG
jgi:hypothetical protein